MNIYSKKQRWNIFLVLLAIIIGAASLWYTSLMVEKLKEEEKTKIEIWAQAIHKKLLLVNYTKELFNDIANEERAKVEFHADVTKKIIEIDDLEHLAVLTEIITSNKNIPLILTNKDSIIVSSMNVEPEPKKGEKIPDEIKSDFYKYSPIEVKYKETFFGWIHYKDSRLFSRIQLILNDLIQSFITDVVVNSASVPVIISDSTYTEILAFGNIDSSEISTPELMKNKIDKMSAQNKPIKVKIDNKTHYVFYEDSFLLTQLKYFPAILIIIIAIFIFIAYLAFNSSRKAEQNQVWVGMSKETAHQLGTPTSSLLAWVELLKLKKIDEEIIDEVEKDINRLETITERFSKIGAAPVLEKTNLVEMLQTSINYIKNRTSQKVSFNVDYNNNEIEAPINPVLFAWVIENLLKNAIDAMEGSGTIEVKLSDHTQFVYIDVIDSGKGIPKSKYKTVFQPGYTTKKRGWGLGLSLTKRIVEFYHKGKIFVKFSEPGKGTTFRIALKKQHKI
ncbi:MAG: HAMP domain-containing histidine kinase [Bacteroidales bacterium]|nr:HAMP domain-containing histidine kinase [Bacteroidales bacterium]